MAVNETLSAFPVKGEDDMWTPYKELQGVVDDCISDPGQKNSLKRLETALRKHKQNFITILKNPPKNSKCREELKHDGGTSFTGAPLAHDLVEEACVLSDMYDLNEFMALQLLMTAERQMPCHPGLPRGLVAVLLYYDGRVALAGALCTLVRARRGVTWDLHAETSSAFSMDDGLDSQKTQLIDYVTRYTDELAGSGLLEHLIDLVEGLELSREIEILHGGRALGGPRHRREVTHLFLSLKQTISDTIFFWSAQTGLTQRPLMRLIAYMKKVKEESENGVLSNVNLSLTMAMLYAIDLGILHRKDDREVLAKKLPLLSDKGVGQELLRCICPSSEEEEGASLEESWACPSLLGLFQLSTGLAVSTLRSAGTSSELILPDALMDEEDNLIDSAVRLCVFEFLYRTILGNSSIYKEEFYLRRLHGLLADFIILHPTKVRELRRAADEAARTIQAYTQEGLEPPSNLQYHFESFLRSIGRLHEQDPLSLQLALDYWPRSTLPDTRHGTAAHILSSAHLLGSADGRGALWRFVRQCGWGDSPHPLPPALFVPYLQMLCGLSSSPRAAAQCFAFLRQQSVQPSPVLIPESRGDSSAISGMGPVPSSPISWDHFFRSLHRYLCNLRVELPPTDTVYSQRSTGGAGVSLISRGITPLELEGLHSVLALLTTIAEQDESSRLALAENATWGAIPSLLGLVTCPVPIPLKARLIRALAALATTSSSTSDRAAESSITTMVWHHLEASQILLTIPTTSCYQPRGVQTELEEVESRNEEYPLTRAMLHLLDALTGPVGPTKSSSSKVSTVPPLLGMGTRVPGLDPYLNYVINSVFLPFASRSYRNMEEKWLVCRLCLRLFLKFLRQYEPSSEDFTTRVVEVREANTTVTGSSVVTATTVAPPPGFHLMIQLHSKSELLRIILSIIDEVVGCLEEANPEKTRSKKERRLMEGCALGCLRVLRRALMLQGRFTTLLSASSEDPLLLTGLDRLLLAVNPRSGKHDHLLNVARYVSQAGWLPKHTPAALGILALATACPRSPSSAAQVHLLSLLTSSPQATAQVRHAFVECMEAEEDEVVDFEEDKDIGPDEADEEDGAAHGESVLEPSEGSSPNSSEPFKGLTIRGRAKEMVLRLLLQWLPQSPAPNLAHFFLGFHLSKDLRKTVFQQPGILGFPRTCLHALLALLDHGLATNLQVTSPSHAQSSVMDVAGLRPRAPHSALLDLGYRLLYALCADPRTSEPVLRFLRSSSSAGGVAGGHYLTRHLLSIPIISPPGEASVCSPQKRCEVNALGQTSWLLRTVAVELKALAANRHHLQLTTLLRTLLSTPSVPGSQALGNTMRTVGPGWPGRAADTSELSVDGSRLGGEEEDKDEETTLQLSRSHLLPVGSLPPSGARPHDRLLIRVLEALNFSPEQTPSPNWEFFEPSQIQQVLRNCEVSIGPGGDSWPHVAPSCPALRLVNLDSLRRTLMDELQSIQVSQRQAIVAEMKEVLKYAKEYNHGRARAWGVARCTEGWCQVTEVLFATTPSEALAPSLHLQLLLDVLQVILKKSLATDVTPDLATMSSGVILLLLVNLRNLHLVAVREARLRCLPQKVGVGKTPMPASQVDTPVTSHLSGRNAPSLGAEATLQANSAALKVILSGILQWIVSSAPPSQKLRINLYGALLNFLHVTCTEGDEWNVGIPSLINFSSGSLSESFRSTLGSPSYAAGSRVKSQPTEEERSQRLACLEVMLGFGEGLVDVLCHDSTSGHDVCKMLALSCLETLVVLDASTGPASTLSLLCARGFLCHLVDSLLASDRTLQGVLEEDEGYAGGGEYGSGGVDLRPLYVYESKMAALCRIARSSRGGAEALLERKVMGCLSAMKVFDARPDGPFWSHADGTVSGEFVPPVAGRYLQIWLPALHLCDALLISLGSRNESCASQVAHFLVSHSEAVGAALRGAGAPRSASTSQGHLQEIACLTGVVALAARHPGIIGPGEGAVPADPLWRVRKLMFSLLPRFLLPEDSPGGKTVGVQGDEETALCVLKVAAHLLLYIRRLSVPDGAVGETGGAADPRECRIVFSPSLSGAELVPSGDPRGARTAAARNIPVRAGGIGTAGPPLGLLVARLVSAVGLDATLAAAETQLYAQLASVPDMNSQELREFLPQGASMTAASMEAARAQAARCLGRRLQQTSRRRELLWFVADHCLLLLWVHLDHFLRRSFSPGDRGITMNLNSTRDDSNWSVDVEEISRLKSGLVSVFNDGFCKRLIETRQEVKDRGFVEALVRRIKRLIQFVPVS